MSQHGLGLKKEGKKQNIDPVFNSSAVLFIIIINNNNNNNNNKKNTNANKSNLNYYQRATDAVGYTKFQRLC
jgi:hypothetical protein